MLAHFFTAESAYVLNQVHQGFYWILPPQMEGAEEAHMNGLSQSFPLGTVAIGVLPGGYRWPQLPFCIVVVRAHLRII